MKKRILLIALISLFILAFVYIINPSSSPMRKPSDTVIDLLEAGRENSVSKEQWAFYEEGVLKELEAPKNLMYKS